MSVQVLELLLCCLTLLFPTGSNGKVEHLGPCTEASVSESILKALGEEGYRVIPKEGEVLCEIWLRKEVATQLPTGEMGASYSEFAESTLIGVISLPNGGSDFRGQPIKAGVYTLRYELMPNDGNHLGAAPTRDFLLLIPASVDANADASYKFDDLVDMSRKASGTHHPALLSLVSPEEKSESPSLKATDESHLVFTVDLKTKAGTKRTIALVVKGQAEQ